MCISLLRRWARDYGITTGNELATIYMLYLANLCDWSVKCESVLRCLAAGFTLNFL